MKKYTVYFEFKYSKSEQTLHLEVEANNKKEAFALVRTITEAKCGRHAFHCRLKEKRW